MKSRYTTPRTTGGISPARIRNAMQRPWDSKPCCHTPAEKGSIFSAAVSLIRWLTFPSYIYVLFNFQSSNSLTGISEYHSGCIHVKILGKLFSIPCGRKFYSPILKIGQGNFIPHPIVHKEAENIRRL